jgi:outer membrane murein-binding lipoprotein Lpp
MDTKEKLDALAEYQAQVDYLNLEKHRLLDEVKIPAEVLAAQDEANRARQRVDANLWTRQRANNESKEAALSLREKPELPPEYVAAMEAYRLEGVAIERKFDQMMQEDQKLVAEAKAKIDADLQAKIADVYSQVANRKAEISAEFDGKAEDAKSNIDKLTAEIKAEVEKLGESIKGAFYHAVYVRGRVSWNTDMLDGMIVAFPALDKARKVGKPSVTIRKI